MNPRSLALLIFCNLIWSFHPLFGKIALESFTPTKVAWLRYTSAAVAYFVIAGTMRIVRTQQAAPLLALPRTPKNGVLLILLGLAPFALSPILQLEGLAQAQSIDNAIIVAMEPLMTVLLAWLILRERPSLIQWIAFLAAIAGFLLLSGVDAILFSSARPTSSWVPYLLMLLALWGEAIYSVLGRKLTRHYRPLPLFGSAITVGALALSIYAFQLGGIPTWSDVTLRSGFAIFWLGPLGTTLAYLIWIRIIRDVPVAAAALTLFIQPVFGTVLGIALRGESFNLTQGLGALLILVAVGFESSKTFRSKSGPTEETP